MFKAWTIYIYAHVLVVDKSAACPL